jgi:eukaryotic-like serine/threonine-protein kinase
MIGAMSGIPAGAGSLLGKRLGKYEIVALLALGGTAEIYLARIEGTAGFEKYVVVKCLHDHLADDPDFVKMFLDEARLASVLDHSNIVQTFELGEHEDRYYMVMEFLAGLSLAMVVRRAAERVPDGKIPVPLIVNIAAQTAGGLHYAHERTANGKPLNMVHRDISPQNLVIGFEGVVKVVDFGIARAEMRETKTKAGTIKGKFAYMSPEQCVATNVDRRTDVFALGVIVHELLTGRRLFKRNSPYETYQAVLECAVSPPSATNHELDPGLDDIIMRAVARDKDERYPTAEAFGDALLGYLHSRGKGSGAGEIGRFFDEYFQPEIEEHGDRMRELLAGRDMSIDSGVSWDEDGKNKKPASPESDDSALSLDSSDIVTRSSDHALDQLVSRLGSESDVRDNDGGQPPETTRIETNPLELLKELDRNQASPKPSTPVPQGSVSGGPAPLPAPPTVGPVSGRFPDSAQLPTIVGADDETHAPNRRPRAETSPDPAMAATAAGRPMRASRPPPELAPTAAAAPLDVRPSAPAIGPLSATHAAVRQSEIHNVVADPGSSPYPVVQSGRPFATDIAPSTPRAGQQRPQPRASDPPPAAGAASFMSPVGESYPAGVDWDAAAARRARALAPWQLALLFVGALGIALLLTMMIAKIVR